MKPYEKMGAFYLGREYDLESSEVTDDLLLYDSKDLTTHAVCVGMTGSGKTGLCTALLEEAAIDGIPGILIDPKGDLGNLLLQFPKLAANDFAPWIDKEQAARKGQTPAEYAKSVAQLWTKGLGSWDQDGSRIERLKAAAEVALYTPGSSAGRPLTVLRSFAAPPAKLLDDGDALRDRVMATVSGLLALLGRDADPIQSRDHILMSRILNDAWAAGQDLDLPSLIRRIQDPGLETIGVFDLESFYPAKERFKLAMHMNNLLASPGFDAWMQGEPLDIPKLLWTDEGKPKLSVLSIAHLTDAERMFFVTLVLNEVLAWVRTQPGTSSLRALLYMDEVFGYFPPTANPPSKQPMLTLLKQARAFGLGCVLATQNPVDLDYKGLSNAGTWFLGRLQTERDKARVLEGLETASATSGMKFDPGKADRALSSLPSRVFLMNNVHDDGPTVFHTRWVMSYLRGPLTRAQIKTLSHADAPPEKKTSRPARAASAPAAAAQPIAPPAASSRPILPPSVEEGFLPAAPTHGAGLPAGHRIVYRPALLGRATLHFANARYDVDVWKDLDLLAPISGKRLPSDPWAQAETLTRRHTLQPEPLDGAEFAELPPKATRATSYKGWLSRFKSHAYQDNTLTLWRCRELKQISEPNETQAEFRARLALTAREARDLEVEKLRQKYAPKFARLKERRRKAEQKVDQQRSQYQTQRTQSAISLGATVLGALFGRKLASASTVGKATTTARSWSRASREKQDIERAEEDVATVDEQIQKLEQQFEQASAEVRDEYDPSTLELEALEVRPRKTDLNPEPVRLVWTPWQVDGSGIAEPLY